MSSAGLSKGTSGNISVFDAETGYMVISPSGIGYLKRSQKTCGYDIGWENY